MQWTSGGPENRHHATNLQHIAGRFILLFWRCHTHPTKVFITSKIINNNRSWRINGHSYSTRGNWCPSCGIRLIIYILLQRLHWYQFWSDIRNLRNLKWNFRLSRKASGLGHCLPVFKATLHIITSERCYCCSSEKIRNNARSQLTLSAVNGQNEKWSLVSII